MTPTQWSGTPRHVREIPVTVRLIGGPYEGAELVMLLPGGMPRSLEHVDGDHGVRWYFLRPGWRHGEPIEPVWAGPKRSPKPVD